MTTEELISQVKAGSFSRAYYFFGDDDYRMQEAMRYVADRFLGVEALAGLTRLDMRETDARKALDELSAFGFFSARRVIVLEEPQKLIPTEVSALTAALQADAPDRIVIFYTRAESRPRKDARFPKAIAEIATPVEFSRLGAAELRRRVERIFAERGVTIEPATLGALVSSVDGDIGKLFLEAEKLSAYVGMGGAITSETLAQALSAGSAQSVYEVVDMIMRGETARALANVERLLASGETPTGVLYWLGEHVLGLYLVKCKQKLFGPRQWLERKLVSQARNMSREWLEVAVAFVAETEAAVKGGGVGRLASMTPEDALRDLVITLAGHAPAAPTMRT